MGIFSSPPAREIKFETFLKFPLFLFRFIFIDFNPPKRITTRRERIQYYAVISYNLIGFLNLALAFLSVFTSVIVNLNNLYSIANAPGNAAVILIILFKYCVTFNYKTEFRENLAEL